MSSTYTDKKTPFHDVQRDIPNLELSPNRTSIGFSQIAFPITVQPKDDRTDFAREERLGLPHKTMILANCVVVDESKCLGLPILEFSIILEHIPFYLGISRYCISCLSCAPWQYGYDIHNFCCCLCDADDPCSVNTAYEPESSFKMSPRSTTRPLYFWCFASNSAFFR